MNKYLNELQRSREKLEQSLKCFDTLHYLADEKFYPILQDLRFLPNDIGLLIRINIEDVSALREILSVVGRITQCKAESFGAVHYDDATREGVMFKADFVPFGAHEPLSFPLKIVVYSLNANGIIGLLLDEEVKEDD